MQIHDFEADPGGCEGAHQRAGRKTLAPAGAEQDDFAAQFEQYPHVAFVQGDRCRGRPLENDRFRQHDQVFRMLFLVDRDIVVAISGEQVESGRGGKMKFQVNICPKSPPKLRCTMR